MLRITADIYSGRPNPSWVVDDREAAEILRNLAQQPDAALAVDAGFQGLGNRGLIVESLADTTSDEYGVPTRFRLAGGTGRAGGKAQEIAERLLRTLPAQGATDGGVARGADTTYEPGLQQYLLDQLATAARVTQTDAVDASGAVGGAVGTVGPAAAAPDAATSAAGVSASGAAIAAAVCQIESGTFNPGFWNDPAHITRNNCYNYASNRRTDTFAQPGRATGAMYAAINCAQVGAGAVHDGARQAPNCAPASENPRWLMALVIAPGPGFIDYHWYRRSREGFWGHKPGGTAARNVDNSGHLVVDPRTANRGPYTIFCGFFYAQRHMVVR